MDEVTLRVRSAASLGTELRGVPPGTKRLAIFGPTGDDGAGVLTRWSGLADVVVLRLHGSQLSDAGISWLASSPHVEGLRAIAIWGSELGERGAEAIARSKLRLTSFAWDGGPELALLLDSPPFAEVDVLTLGPSRDAALAFASRRKSTRPPTLGKLCFTGTRGDDDERRLGPEGAIAIARSPHCEALQSLTIRGTNAIGPSGGEAIASARFASTLEELEIEGWGPGTALTTPEIVVGDATLIRIATAPSFGRLRRLMLDRSHIGPGGIAALVESTTLHALEELVLTRNWDIDAASIAKLVGSPLADRLRILDLSWTGGGKGGGRAIAESPRLQRIEKLAYSCNDIEQAHDALYDQGAEIVPAHEGDEEAFMLLSRFGDRVSV
jgi:hypothetical protein